MLLQTFCRLMPYKGCNFPHILSRTNVLMKPRISLFVTRSWQSNFNRKTTLRQLPKRSCTTKVGAKNKALHEAGAVAIYYLPHIGKLALIVRVHFALCCGIGTLVATTWYREMTASEIIVSPSLALATSTCGFLVLICLIRFFTKRVIGLIHMHPGGESVTISRLSFIGGRKDITVGINQLSLFNYREGISTNYSYISRNDLKEKYLIFPRYATINTTYEHDFFFFIDSIYKFKE